MQSVATRTPKTEPSLRPRWLFVIGAASLLVGLALTPSGRGSGPIVGGSIALLTAWSMKRSWRRTAAEPDAHLLTRTVVPPWQLAIASGVFLAAAIFMAFRQEGFPVDGFVGEVFPWVAVACGLYLGCRGLSWLCAAWLLDHGHGGRVAKFIVANMAPMLRP